MVKFTRWLVHGVNRLLHAKFQQFTLYGFDAMTILVLTYFVDGFQPEGPLKNSTVDLWLVWCRGLCRVLNARLCEQH